MRDSSICREVFANHPRSLAELECLGGRCLGGRGRYLGGRVGVWGEGGGIWVKGGFWRFLDKCETYMVGRRGIWM